MEFGDDSGAGEDVCDIVGEQRERGGKLGADVTEDDTHVFGRGSLADGGIKCRP